MTDGAARLLAFAKERHAIYERRQRGQAWPWTEDPILRAYRFCNVYRELDKETQLLHNNWLRPHTEDLDVWFACVVARLVNWWPSLQPIGYPVPWSAAKFVRTLDARRAAGEKVFTGAYMVRADAVIGGTKAAYLAEHVLAPLWKARAYVRPSKGDTLSLFHSRLMEFRDMGSFMAGQVIADAKHFDTALRYAGDRDLWAAPGPGSLRGLNRVLGRPYTAAWSGPNSWFKEFSLLHIMITPLIKAAGLPLIDGQNLQNCLCEFDKYERTRLGQGQPRSHYLPPEHR